MNQKNILIVIIVILLMAVSGMGGYLISQKLASPKSTAQEPIVPTPTVTPSPTASQVASEVKGDVTWSESLEKVENPDIFLKNSQTLAENPSKISTTYKVGDFVSGKYRGAELLLVFSDSMSPEGFYLYRVVKDNDKMTLLKKQSDDIEGYLDAAKISEDENYTVKQLSSPAYILGPKEGQTLKRADYQTNEFFKKDQKTSVFFTDEKYGEVYSYGDGGFAVKKSDGTFTIYVLEMPFLSDNNIPYVDFNDGIPNDKEYTSAEVGGCGFTNFAYVVSSKDGIDEKNDLITIGQVERTEEPIFGFKNKNHPYLKKMYKETYSVIEGKKVSYSKFIKDRPLFFWRDPFGRLIRFYKIKYGPAAECGKPVIYLYPKKETKISVSLDLKGGLRYSDPPYGNGWTVIASSDGELLNLGDDKKYPYLFWEGKGVGIYKRPSRGFVISRNNVYKFLVDKLTKLGFNKKEIADFIEFWEPRMKDSPYYFVTFLTTKGMDRIAPLKISPEPDTIIRVLMDFTSLEKPINVEEPYIQTPERKGFTVMEWGGVLR